MRLWNGCGAAAGRLGWLRDGCGEVVGAAGRLRGGCGAAAGRLQGGCALDTKAVEFAQGDFGPGGGTLQPIGGCAKTQKNCKWEDTPAENTKNTAEFAQGDFEPSGRTL